MSARDEAGQGRLRANALGVSGIVFVVVAMAGPLSATLGAAPLAFMSNGVGTPGAYLAAGIVLLLFAVGFSAMSVHVTSAGGFAVYVSRALGQRAGIATAFVALLAYNGMLLGLYALIGFFAEAIIDDEFGLHLPWQAWTLIVIALVAVLGYRDVNLSARVLGLLMLLEVAIVVIFDVAVIGSGGDDGLSLAPFDPGNVFDGAYGIALLFAFASFVGFEATAIYGEEAREPRRTIPRATYVAVIIIGLFYVLATYSITMAVGTDRIAGAAADSTGTFIFDANTRFVGSWSTHVMNVLTVTSFFAVVLAFHNTLARYVYSLGRGGVLPPLLGRTHRAHRSPHVASVAQSAGALVVLVVFMLAGADPFTEVYAWLVGVGTVGVLVLQAAVALVVVVFFRRTGLDRRPWHTVVAPLLGAAGLIYAIVMSVRHFGVLTGSTSDVVRRLYWLIPIAAVVGAAVGVWRTREGADLERGFRGEPTPLAAVAADEEEGEVARR
jgi:amino acid transporter